MLLGYSHPLRTAAPMSKHKELTQRTDSPAGLQNTGDRKAALGQSHLGRVRSKQKGENGGRGRAWGQWFSTKGVVSHELRTEAAVSEGKGPEAPKLALRHRSLRN